jgi:hypothetical protein
MTLKPLPTLAPSDAAETSPGAAYDSLGALTGPLFRAKHTASIQVLSATYLADLAVYPGLDSDTPTTALEPLPALDGPSCPTIALETVSTSADTVAAVDA